MTYSLKNHRQKIIWGLFILTAVVGLIESNSLTKAPILATFKFSFVLQFILLLVHAASTLGCLRGFSFIAIAALMGFVAEAVAMHWGFVFEGHYVYEATTFTVFGVPLLVMLYWPCFIYGGYSIVSSFLLWGNRDKPSVDKKNMILLALLIVLDGLVVVVIDLFMDPIMTRMGNWKWTLGGSYYNTPTGNYTSWFFVVILATGAFRVFEYFRPQKPTGIPESIHLMPVIGYGMLCGVLTFSALKLRMYSLASICLVTMFPIVAVNFVLFLISRKRRPK